MKSPTDISSEEQISFRQIKAFIAVAEQRNLTKAAHLLHLTQSGLSRTINSLESIVGEELFGRSAKGIVLTAYGSAFMPYARRLHGCYLAALTATEDVSTRRFTLAGCDIVLPSVSPLLSTMTSAQMRADLAVNSLPSHLVLEQVASGHADLGLCMYGAGGRDDLQMVPLLDAPLGLLTAKQLRLPSVISTLEHLARIPMARLAEEMVLPQLLLSRDVQFDAYFQSRNISNSMLAVVAAAATGHVATIVSAVAASSDICRGLQFLPLPHLLPSLQLCLVKPGSTSSADQSGDWEKFIRKSVSQLPWLPSVGRLDAQVHSG